MRTCTPRRPHASRTSAVAKRQPTCASCWNARAFGPCSTGDPPLPPWRAAPPPAPPHTHTTTTHHHHYYYYITRQCQPFLRSTRLRLARYAWRACCWWAAADAPRRHVAFPRARVAGGARWCALDLPCGRRGRSVPWLWRDVPGRRARPRHVRGKTGQGRSCSIKGVMALKAISLGGRAPRCAYDAPPWGCIVRVVSPTKSRKVSALGFLSYL